jgi:hypothetical protein
MMAPGWLFLRNDCVLCPVPPGTLSVRLFSRNADASGDVGADAVVVAVAVVVTV